MPEASVDAIVTDPPYGLSFMGKKWDYDVPSEEVWAECLRVLKPGGHLLAFAGTRTQHRMAVRIEDAGFEIRDLIMYCYGSGFPKSHNVNKALGKLACNCGSGALPYTHEKGLSREPQAEREVRPLRHSDVSPTMGLGERRGQVLQSRLQEQSAPSHRALPVQGAQGRSQSSMEGRRNPVQEEGQLHRGDLRAGSRMGDADGQEGWLYHAAPPSDGPGLRFPADPKRGSGSPGPQSEQQRSGEPCALPEQRGSQAWGGWPVCVRCGKPMVSEGLGTALKPALEPITMARKPFKGTVAANVLQWGTGGINVDGCRVEGVPPSVPQPVFNSPTGRTYNMKTGKGRNGDVSQASGRWPANMLHDGSDEVVGLFPSPHGAGAKRGGGQVKHGDHSSIFGIDGHDSNGMRYGDSGSAARFFYCAKTSKRERGEGNNHPTVKPLALMRYLCRLVTPPGGIILDPFMGSGTTGIAAIEEGFDFIGIEKEQAYYEISERRIATMTNDGG